MVRPDSDRIGMFCKFGRSEDSRPVVAAIWLNRVEEGEFQIEAFEQANIIVGGLVAVIALNFTLNAEYGALSSSDNTVRRLLALNYLALALSLVVNLALLAAWLGRFGINTWPEGH